MEWRASQHGRRARMDPSHTRRGHSARRWRRLARLPSTRGAADTHTAHTSPGGRVGVSVRRYLVELASSPSEERQHRAQRAVTQAGLRARGRSAACRALFLKVVASQTKRSSALDDVRSRSPLRGSLGVTPSSLFRRRIKRRDAHLRCPSDSPPTTRSQPRCADRPQRGALAHGARGVTAQRCCGGGVSDVCLNEPLIVAGPLRLSHRASALARLVTERIRACAVLPEAHASPHGRPTARRSAPTERTPL